MSMTEIEFALDKMTSAELRRLALRSWSAYVAKEGGADASCEEEDPQLLAALDEAVRRADATPGQGHSGDDLRARIAQWTTK